MSAAIQASFSVKGKDYRENSPLVFRFTSAAEKASKNILKIFILIVCSGGFAYQMIDFLSFYYTYPIETEYVLPIEGNFTAPHLMICNANLFSRTKYCERYAEDCENLTENIYFQQLYPQFRNNSNLMFPVHLKSFENGDEDLVDELDVEMTSNAIDYHMTTDLYDAYGHHCIAIWAGLLQGTEETDAFETFLFGFNIVIDSSEASSITSPPAAALSLFPPHADKGEELLLKTGSVYFINIELEEQRLLPFPYETDCRNYTDEWLRNNKTGPLSSEECLDMCQERVEIETCGCRSPIRHHSRVIKELKNKCVGEDIDSCKEKLPFESMDINCKKLCKRSCVRRKYKMQVLSYWDLPEKTTAIVNLLWAPRPVTIINFKPAIQDVQLYSHIGGYLGLWMGVCVFACFDWISSCIKSLILFTKILYSSCTRRARDKFEMLKLISG